MVGGLDQGRRDTFGGHGRIETPDRLGRRGVDRSGYKEVIPEALAEVRLVAGLGFPGGPLGVGPTVAGLLALHSEGWQRLDVSVTPTQVTTWVNGFRIATWDRADPFAAPGWVLPGPKNRQTIVPPPAGTSVGLYVTNGTAYFRNVVLRSKP